MRSIQIVLIVWCFLERIHDAAYFFEILQGEIMGKVKNVMIVSLSSGILGETFLQHEMEIGVKRLEAYGLKVNFSKNALKGMEYLQKHPEVRAEDLIEAFQSDADMILTAIGGDDTYRLLPYLFEHDELKKAVKEKIFLGFSDTTINHLMLYQAGLNTFYGQSFLPDVCEMDDQMLPYTRQYFEELLQTGRIRKIVPSDVWYDSRTDFSLSAVGTKMQIHPNKGYLLLQGKSCFEGEILGGCIDTLYDIFNNERYADSVELCRKYHLFPEKNDWKGKILLLESSEEKPSPEKYEKMLDALKKTGVFDVVRGVLIGKPDGEAYFEEYKTLLRKVVNNPELPIVANINVGHAAPRCIIPFGIKARVDVKKQEIVFSY